MNEEFHNDIIARFLVFLDKYQDHSTFRDSVMLGLLNYTDKYTQSCLAFVLAAKYDYPVLAKTFFAKINRSTWGNYESNEKRGSKHLEPVMHPAYLPPQYLRHLPPAYIWALARAHVDPKATTEIRSTAFGEALEKWKSNERFFNPIPRE